MLFIKKYYFCSNDSADSLNTGLISMEVGLQFYMMAVI